MGSDQGLLRFKASQRCLIGWSRSRFEAAVSSGYQHHLHMGFDRRTGTNAGGLGS